MPRNDLVHVVLMLDEADYLALYNKYSGDDTPMPVFMAFDLRTGRLWVDYEEYVRGRNTKQKGFDPYDSLVWGTPAVLRWHFPDGVVPTPAFANRLMTELVPVFQRLLDGAWYSSNSHGGTHTTPGADLNDAARAARGEIDKAMTMDALQLQTFPSPTFVTKAMLPS